MDDYKKAILNLTSTCLRDVVSRNVGLLRAVVRGATQQGPRS